MATRPTTAADWATDANHPAGTDAWSGQANKVQPSAGRIASGFTPNEDLSAEELNWELNNHGQWIDFAIESMGLAAFGDGSDGDVTLGLSTTITRDMFYNNLTLTGGNIISNGFRIYVRDTLTTNGHPIKALATDAGPTAVQGAGAPAGTVGGGGAGAAGGGQNFAGSNAAALINALGGAGGVGGNSDTQSHGTPGSVTAPVATAGRARAFSAATIGHILGIAGGVSTWTAIQGGTGGSGGAGGSAGGGAGGGGGGGGGVLVVCARNIVLTNASDLIAAGGAGASTSQPTSGGGGGGGGGVLILAYASISIGSGALSAAINCPGGPGGTGTQPTSGNGTAGANGTLIQINLASTSGSAPVLSSPHVEQGYSAITDGVGAGHEYLDVSWTTPFPSATGASGYRVDTEINQNTDDGTAIAWTVTSKTTTGFRLRFSAAFDGEVRWRAS